MRCVCVFVCGCAVLLCRVGCVQRWARLPCSGCLVLVRSVCGWAPWMRARRRPSECWTTRAACRCSSTRAAARRYSSQTPSQHQRHEHNAADTRCTTKAHSHAADCSPPLLPCYVFSSRVTTLIARRGFIRLALEQGLRPGAHYGVPREVHVQRLPAAPRSRAVLPPSAQDARPAVRRPLLHGGCPSTPTSASPSTRPSPCSAWSSPATSRWRRCG